MAWDGMVVVETWFGLWSSRGSSRSMSEFVFFFGATPRSSTECLRWSWQTLIWPGELWTLWQLRESGLSPDLSWKWGEQDDRRCFWSKLSLVKSATRSLELSEMVILILGWDGVAGVTDITVGETWLLIVRRAGEADREIYTEGLGVLNSSWMTGMILLLCCPVGSFLSRITEVTRWDSWFLCACEPDRYWECSLEK